MTGTQVHPAPEPGRLTIQRRNEADRVVLTIRGEIDMASGATLARELYAAERPLLRRLVLDLAALDFIDCTGIEVLLHAQERAESNGHVLVLTNVPANVQRLFSLTGLDAHLMRPPPHIASSAVEERDPNRRADPERQP